MIEIQADMNRIMEIHDRLLFFSDQLPGVTAAAIADTIKEGKEVAVDSLAQSINAPRAALASRVGTSEPDRPNRLVVKGTIFLRGRPIRLKQLRARQVAGGVNYQPYRTGSGKFIPSAFGPNIPRLGRGVFRRTGRARTPIEREPGLKLTSDPVARRAMKRAEQKLKAVLRRNINKHVHRMLTELASGRTVYNRLHINRLATDQPGFRTVSL